MKRSLLFVALASFVAACCPPEPAAVAPAPAAVPPPPVAVAPDFRAKPPEPGPAVVFVPPKIEEARLPNGIRVLVVERRGLPIVAVHVSFSEGADQAAPGVGSFAGSMLMRGTTTRSGVVLSDQLAALGADVSASADFDSVQLAGKALTTELTGAMAIIADVLEHPAFAKDEVERERSRRLTQIAQQKDRPRTLLSNTVAELLYPAGSPYASPLIATEDVVKKITTRDLQEFHRARVSPGRMTIAFAGDIDKARAVSEAERAFGSWKAATTPAAARGGGGAAHGGAPRVLLVDRPGATQSSVSIATVGVPRKVADFDAITLMNTILGGAFSSRINMNLREEHAYTYGAYSSFDFRHEAGPFTASGEIVREKTGPAIAEVLKEIGRMRTELVSAEELADAKGYLIKQLPSRFETVLATAATLASLAVYDLPLDEFATRPERWAKVTREDVQRAAVAHLVPAAMHVVLVGDAKIVKPQLDALGLGDVVVRAAAH